jgi:hypothetical protein
MKSLKWVLAAMAVSLVAACGGGGGCAGNSGFGAAASGAACGSGSSKASSIDVIASSVQVGTGGDTITITATVKDASNVGLGGAPVVFSATSGNLTGVTSTTSTLGVATATFTSGANRSNRQATVTVTSGSVSGQILLDITGTVLSYQGVTTVPLNSTTDLPVKVVDSKNAPVGNLAITVASSLGNGLAAPTVTTDSNGTATVTYTATTPGADTLTLSGGGATKAPTIQVSAADFTFLTPAAATQIPVTTSQTVTVKYLSGNVVQVGKTINFAATAGVLSSPTAITDVNGQATVSISSKSASPAVIQASVSGAAVQATLPVSFVALVPAKLVLQVSPTAIGPNPAGSTAQQSQILATVSDANGNPVSGAIVTFNRLADPSGGQLSQASTATDSNGQAAVQYVAGALTTASNGVQIQATVLGAPAVSGTAQLTVNQSALFIALGTGNTITNLDEQTYKKDWVVYVTDSNGVAVPNISLTIKILPTEYRKGNLVYSGSWVYDATPGHYFSCQNEDNGGPIGANVPANAYNGILDPGEDFNQDGRLEPGNVVAVTTAQTPTASSSGIAKTGIDGRATLTLLYAESYVPWVKVKLTAQAIVSGTESSTEANFVIVGAASDFNNAAVPPAGVISPFGVNDCATAD